MFYSLHANQSNYDLGLKCKCQHLNQQHAFGTGLSVWWNNGKWGVRSVQETVIISILLDAAEFTHLTFNA